MSLRATSLWQDYYEPDPGTQLAKKEPEEGEEGEEEAPAVEPEE